MASVLPLTSSVFESPLRSQSLGCFFGGILLMALRIFCINCTTIGIAFSVQPVVHFSYGRVPTVNVFLVFVLEMKGGLGKFLVVTAR